ncbi:PREDICTED: uncharacterized protein LOC104600297 isoform X2 [Nelumbo nucifera]|uniref:Uncharacterized protein LOC104600297 isoform X2 n=1 Tax=Nelumbo nucifera TaxID=4432 RepID=A0A1U8AHD8_NELNU|nr:PREDICTED: uncharacterized protein LOC104600297 isoform X2 [Nelumbo nucifera]
MDYDFRNRAGPPYDSHNSMYRPNASSSSSSHPHHGSSLYPRVGQPGHAVIPPASRTTPHHQIASPSLGLGIRVAIKPEYRITPPPQLSPQMEDIPRSTFQFDFEFEKKILAEAEKESQNWSKLVLENLPSRGTESISSLVREFVNGYNLLSEMGFSSNSVVEALAMYDNDTEKALAHFLNNPS